MLVSGQAGLAACLRVCIASWKLVGRQGGGLTDAESEEEEERHGVRAETPAELAFWVLH